MYWLNHQDPSLQNRWIVMLNITVPIIEWMKKGEKWCGVSLFFRSWYPNNNTIIIIHQVLYCSVTVWIASKLSRKVINYHLKKTIGLLNIHTFKVVKHRMAITGDNSYVANMLHKARCSKHGYRFITSHPIIHCI